MPSWRSSAFLLDVAHDREREAVEDEREHEEDEREVRERGNLEVRDRSLVLAAILLASVSPVWKNDHWMPAVVPITCVTAIASPSARPSPSTEAARRPGPTYGIVTRLVVSHCVEPSAYEPSWISCGTRVKSSRATLETIGTVMMTRTRIADRIPADW